MARPYGGGCDIGSFEAELLQPYLFIEPAVLTFVAVAGADSPPAQTFQIENTGTDTLTWTATETISWLGLSSISGTAPATVAVTADNDSLSVGVYQGDVTINSNGLNSPQVVSVTLHVIDAADLLQNGDFELGRDGSWVGEWLIQQAPAFSQYTTPHPGNWSVLMGGLNGAADTLAQTVRLPAGGDVWLSYYYYIDSPETECQWDKADVRIGETTIATHELCAANTTTTWQRQAVALTEFTGEVVSLQFRLENDILEAPSVFLLDDVRLWFNEPPPGQLALNYETGAPGSFFTLSGTDFPPTTTLSIEVNGHVLGAVQTDASGSFTAILSTETADPGLYQVRAILPAHITGESVTFTLDPTAPLRSQEDSGTMIVVPPGIAVEAFFVFLPVVIR